MLPLFLDSIAPVPLGTVLGVFQVIGMLLLSILVILRIYWREVEFHVKCPHCRKKYTFAYQLRRQIKGEEFDGRVMACEACGGKFKFKKLLGAMGSDPSFITEAIHERAKG